MRFNRPWKYAIFLSIAILIGTTTALAQWRSSAPATGPAVSQQHLINPDALARELQAGKAKPLILNVGPRLLFAQAHIPGAEFIGPGSEPQSIELLKKRVKTVPKSKYIVLYCGCCPWQHCPNVEPAYKELRALGFTNVKVLFIASNLGVDWVYKGYPTVRGQ